MAEGTPAVASGSEGIAAPPPPPAPAGQEQAAPAGGNGAQAPAQGNGAQAPAAPVGGSLAQGGAPAPAAADPAPTTLAGGKTPEIPVAVTPTDYPQDWRQRFAGEDKTELKQLERFATPADLYKSYKAMQTRLSSGQLKAALPENATPEQVATWRKDNGIPDKPEAYVSELKLPNGMIPGEADKPLLESFAQTAHAKNWTPQQYSDALTWYYQMQDQLAAQRVEADDAYKVDAMTELTSEWGREYRPNINSLANMMALFPKGAADRLFGGRTADGRLIGDDTEILRGLVAIAREFNPAGAFLPAGMGNNVTDISTRIGEIEGMMKNNASSYWSKDQGPAIQAEYRSLVEAREKMKARAA